MKIGIGKNEYADHIDWQRPYKRIPKWIKEILEQAKIQDVAIPNNIIVCKNFGCSALSKDAIRVGAYLNLDGGIVVCFIGGKSDAVKKYILGHEIGHHDHNAKGIYVNVPGEVKEKNEQQEEYADGIAMMLCGIYVIPDIVVRKT